MPTACKTLKKVVAENHAPWVVGFFMSQQQVSTTCVVAKRALLVPLHCLYLWMTGACLS